jgi:hypothetical protein
MAEKLPLTKARLLEILTLFHPGVTMHVEGGYDTGVYFSFKGQIRPDSEHLIGTYAGRLVWRYGFCSEKLQATNFELYGRGGLDQFWARVERRRKTLASWLPCVEPT